MRPTCRNDLIMAGVSLSDIPLVGVCTCSGRATMTCEPADDL